MQNLNEKIVGQFELLSTRCVRANNAAANQAQDGEGEGADAEVELESRTTDENDRWRGLIDKASAQRTSDLRPTLRSVCILYSIRI